MASARCFLGEHQCGLERNLARPIVEHQAGNEPVAPQIGHSTLKIIVSNDVVASKSTRIDITEWLDHQHETPTDARHGAVFNAVIRDGRRVGLLFIAAILRFLFAISAAWHQRVLELRDFDCINGEDAVGFRRVFSSAGHHDFSGENRRRVAQRDAGILASRRGRDFHDCRHHHADLGSDYAVRRRRSALHSLRYVALAGEVAVTSV